MSLSDPRRRPVLLGDQVAGFAVIDVTLPAESGAGRAVLQMNMSEEARRELLAHAEKLGLSLAELVLRSLALHQAVWEHEDEQLILSSPGKRQRVCRVTTL